MRPDPNLAEIDVAANLAAVRGRIRAAALRSGRDPAAIQLVAVSKTRPLSMIVQAYAEGQRAFGENRLEELATKAPEARALGLDEIAWHVIGNIQSRKTQMAVGPYALIHSVDRVKIAQRLSRDAQTAGSALPVLLEVNVSGEGSKHGFSAQELLEAAPELIGLPCLKISGLMTMAPFVADESIIRNTFRQLRQLRDRLQQLYPTVNWRHLSMGMTNDFEIAIEEGATIVRIGSAIFGAR